MLRFAPSPTGDMHIGTLRVAILNYLIAQQKNDAFLVRIEDSDKAQNIEGKDTEIMQILEKFALIHTSVFHQSEHLHMHQTLAIKLLEEDKAFVCTCTPEEIEADQEKAKAKKIDYVYSGHCQNKDKIEHAKLKESGKPFVLRIHDTDAFVILRVDGTPTYDFACACADMLSGITMIVREEDDPRNTPRQKHIKTQLGYEEETVYIDLPSILNHEGEKMTKSDDTFLVKWLFQEGFIPDAIINYLLLLGNDKAPKEIFTLPEAIGWFDIHTITSATAKFDLEKMQYINRAHLALIDDKKLSTLFGFADANIGKLAKLYLEEVSTTTELEAKILPIFSPKSFDGQWGKEMRIMADIIKDAPMISTYDDFEAHILKKSNLKASDMLKPLRYLLTASEEGPELSALYPLIKSYLLEVAS